MSKEQAFVSRTVEAGERRFSVQVLRFENGSIVSVSEGPSRIGAMAVSVAAGPAPATTTVIPSKTDPLFIKLAAERLSSAVQGISVVTVSTRAEIDTDSARAILTEMTEMARNV